MKDISAAKFVPTAESLVNDEAALTACFPIDYKYVADTHNVLRAVMVFVDFKNARADDLHNRYGSFDYYYDALAVEGLEFFKKASFGKMKFTIDRVDKWYHLPENDEDYSRKKWGWEWQPKYMQAVVDLTENDIDYRKYDMVYIVPPKTAVNIPYSPTMCERTTSNVFTSYGARIGLCVTVGQDMHKRRGRLLVHETGHMTGMPDYYTHHTEEGIFAHCGGWDLMGWIEGRAPDFLGYGKWRYGWFDDDQVDVFTEPGTYKHFLTPVELEKGNKIAVIPIDSNTGYVAESRRGIGLDKDLEDRQGVLIYYINGHKGTCDGCLSICTPDPANFIKLDKWSNDELFGTQEGQIDTFCDEKNGITIKVIDSGADGDTIEVTRKQI